MILWGPWECGLVALWVCAPGRMHAELSRDMTQRLAGRHQTSVLLCQLG